MSDNRRHQTYICQCLWIFKIYTKSRRKEWERCCNKTFCSVENKTSVANGLDGSTIYTNVTASISSALLEKSEYGVKVNDKDPVFATVEGVKCVGFGGNEWKSHTVSQIKWTFDGVSVTKALTESQTVHVTGIPYTYNFRDTNNKDTWTSAKWTLNGTIATGAGIGSLTTAGARIHARTSYRDGWKTKYKSEQGYLLFS